MCWIQLLCVVREKVLYECLDTCTLSRKQTDKYTYMHKYTDSNAQVSSPTYKYADTHKSMHIQVSMQIHTTMQTHASMQMHVYRCMYANAHAIMLVFKCTFLFGQHLLAKTR